MSPRTLGLAAGAVVILGGLVYLLVQVQAGPGTSVDPAPPVGPTSARAEASSAPAEPARTRSAAIPIPAAKVEPVAPPEVGPAPAPGSVPVPRLEGTPAARSTPDVHFEAALDEANKHYDRGDYESALKQSLANLERDPENVRSLRVAVSAACMVGDQEVARKHNAALPHRDQMEMTRRCERFGISLDQREPTVKNVDRATLRAIEAARQ